MRIGVPKEIKDNEFRVGLIPSSVAELKHHGHTVLVEIGAGEGAGLSDGDYVDAGADIVASADRIFADADMIVKVKEPLAVERKMLRAGQVLFTYLHLAPDLAQTEDLIESKAVCIAYETVTFKQRLLASPHTNVRGRGSAGPAGGGPQPRKSARRSGHSAGRCTGCSCCRSRHPRRGSIRQPRGDGRCRHGRSGHGCRSLG